MDGNNENKSSMMGPAKNFLGDVRTPIQPDPNGKESKAKIQNKYKKKIEFEGRFEFLDFTSDLFYAKAVGAAPVWKRVNGLNAIELKRQIYIGLANDVKEETARLFGLSEEKIVELMEDAGATFNLIGRAIFDPSQNPNDNFFDVVKAQKNLSTYLDPSTGKLDSATANTELKRISQKFFDAYRDLDDFHKFNQGSTVSVGDANFQRLLDKVQDLKTNNLSYKKTLSGYWSDIQGDIGELLMKKDFQKIEQDFNAIAGDRIVGISFQSLKAGGSMLTTPTKSQQSNRTQRDTYFRIQNVRITGQNPQSKGDVTLEIAYYDSQGEKIGNAAEISFSVKNYYTSASKFSAATSLSLQNLLVKRKSLINFLSELVSKDVSSKDYLNYTYAEKKQVLGAVFADFIIGGRADAQNQIYRSLVGFSTKRTGKDNNPQLDISVFFLSDYFLRLSQDSKRNITVGSISGPTPRKMQTAKKGIEPKTNLSERLNTLKATTLQNIKAPLIKFYS